MHEAGQADGDVSRRAPMSVSVAPTNANMSDDSSQAPTVDWKEP